MQAYVRAYICVCVHPTIMYIYGYVTDFGISALPCSATKAGHGQISEHDM